jgi:glutathionyl-hydroquinone reductase
LKGLDGIVTLINAGRPDLTATGWDIAEGVDHVNGFRNTKEIYLRANPEYKNRYTVPILWDQKEQTIGISSRDPSWRAVNNESSEIIRIFNSAFDELLDEKYAKRDFHPEALRGEIDGVNEWVYNQFNNGVYKTGFASVQAVCMLTHRQPC